MTSWEEIRSAGTEDARAVLAQAGGRQRIVTAFAEWWRERDQGKKCESERVILRPSAERLAKALRAEGMGMAADFALSEWIKEGPIHPGTWLFAIVLGESFVAPFVSALLAREWLAPNFFGLESYGAWEAFDISLRKTLRTASDARNAAIWRLQSTVEKVKDDPVGSIHVHARDRENMKERATRYLASPDIDEAWEHPFDPPVWLEDSFLWDAMLEVRPTETLELLGNMPHPVFMRNCLRGERLAARPEEVGGLIRAAPVAFNAGGEFQANGAVTALLLEIASATIGRAVLESDGSIRVVPLDKPELLAPTIERCQAAVRTILDALFSRRDATSLAWAWLECTVFIGKPRARQSDSGRGLTVNLPLIAIGAIAERLSWRHDWKQWIQERKELWQIPRLIAVIAVETFSEAPDEERLASTLEWALIDGEIDYAGIENAMADSQDAVGVIGGQAISTFQDPAGRFEAMWKKLRPIREQNWRVGTRPGEHNNSGELLTLWGFAAHDFLAPRQRRALWASLEKSVRDSWQTDTFRHAPVSSRALVRLFTVFEVENNDGGAPVEQQLAQVLLPYIAADYGFLTLVVSLTEQRWPIEVIRDAVAIAGFDLGCLVSQFLDMKKKVFELPQANRLEISRFRKLAESVARQDADRNGSRRPK